MGMIKVYFNSHMLTVYRWPKSERLATFRVNNVYVIKWAIEMKVCLSQQHNAAIVINYLLPFLYHDLICENSCC